MTKVLDKKLIVTVNLWGLMQDAKLDKIQAMAQAMAQHNADFPNIQPPPADVLANLAALRQVREQVRVLQEQQKALTENYARKESDLVDILTDHWMPYVQQQADGDVSKVLAVGFGVKGQGNGRGDHSHLASASDSYPLMHEVDTNVRLQHTLYFVNAITTRRAKPKGAERIEIFEKIDGPAPASVADMNYVGATSKPMFINHFDPEDAGKTVYYAFRYVDTQNRPGPQSPIQTALVT